MWAARERTAALGYTTRMKAMGLEVLTLLHAAPCCSAKVPGVASAEERVLHCFSAGLACELCKDFFPKKLAAAHRYSSPPEPESLAGADAASRSAMMQCGGSRGREGQRNGFYTALVACARTLQRFRSKILATARRHSPRPESLAQPVQFAAAPFTHRGRGGLPSLTQ